MEAGGEAHRDSAPGFQGGTDKGSGEDGALVQDQQERVLEQILNLLKMLYFQHLKGLACGV